MNECLCTGFTFVVDHDVYRADLFAHDEALYVAGFGREYVSASEEVLTNQHYHAEYDKETGRLKFTPKLLNFMNEWYEDFIHKYPQWAEWEVRFSPTYSMAFELEQWTLNFIELYYQAKLVHV
jgi:hypothetical protein